MKIRKLKISDVTWRIEAIEDHIPVRGNALASGDDAEDKREENRIIKELENGNVWAWAAVIVTGTYKGLLASEYLGCCSYADEDDFKTGGYYEDMRAQVLYDLQAQLEELVADAEEEVT